MSADVAAQSVDDDTRSTDPGAVAPDGGVPVEYRLMGLDRRILPSTIGVALVVLLWAVIVPWIASQVSYGGETVEPGTVIDLGSGVSFTPTPGWEIEAQGEEATPGSSG